MQEYSCVRLRYAYHTTAKKRASRKTAPPVPNRRGQTDSVLGNTAQFVGSVGDAFSAICCLQIFRFTSSKPSKSAIASDEKFIRLRTNSFVRYCLYSTIYGTPCSFAQFMAKLSSGALMVTAQPAKASSAMLVTLAGILILVTLLSAKARLSMR